MRSLTIVLFTDKPIALPMSYNHLLQGLLYDCWREDVPQLHDEGFGEGDKRLRLFTYSWLEGRHVADRERKEVVFDGIARLEVRTMHEELLDVLAERLAQKGAVRIGRQELRLVNLESRDRLLFPPCARIRMRTPVTAHRTEYAEDGARKTVYPQAVEADFLELCRLNLARKLEAAGIDAPAGLQLIPLAETLRMRVVRFKGTSIPAWSGQFIASAAPETLALLYHAGLGSNNSQGFGMFDIDERPI